MVARRQPGLPDPVVGLVPAAFDRLHHRLDDAPVLVLAPIRAQPRRRPRDRRSARRRRAGSGGWPRSRSAPAATRRSRATSRSRPRARARAPRPCRAGAAAPDGRRCGRCTRRPSAGAPRPRRASRGRRARAPTSRRHAASSSGSPSCARRRAPRGAPSSPQRGSSPSARGRARASVSALRTTSFLAMSGSSSPPTQSSDGCSARACRSSIESGWGLTLWESKRSSSGNVPTGGREVDDRARRVVAAVLEDVPLDAGGVERDRLVVAEHEQPVAERLQLDRHLAELRPRSELEPRDAAPREHADERRAAVAAPLVDRPAWRHRSEPAPRASRSPSRPTSASRRSSCPAGSAGRAGGPGARA